MLIAIAALGLVISAFFSAKWGFANTIATRTNVKSLNLELTLHRLTRSLDTQTQDPGKNLLTLPISSVRLRNTNWPSHSHRTITGYGLASAKRVNAMVTEREPKRHFEKLSSLLLIIREFSGGSAICWFGQEDMTRGSPKYVRRLKLIRPSRPLQYQLHGKPLMATYLRSMPFGPG